jgi:L-gulonate 5-dehydrogenase
MGRGNVCERFSLVGIHTDGGLQERLTMPQGQVFPIAVDRPEVAALAEPVSIAVRAVNRGRVAGGERIVVIGAGPSGPPIAGAALARRAAVLLVDRLEARLELARRTGADVIAWTTADAVVGLAREWAGDTGPPVVLDATGVPEAIRAAVDMAPSAGRVVIVGMGPHEVALRVGSFTEKELDVLGTSVCTSAEFAQAVALVERNGARLEGLVTHEFAFERAPEALVYAMENPTEVMKVVIRGA